MLERSRMRSRGSTSLCVLAALAVICAAASAQEQQKTVHLIFSSHLDIGFTDLDNAVIELHWYTHYPRAIQLARWFERHGDGDGFRYLTHSWLIALFFDCPARVGVTCPSAEDKQELSDAIKQGVIYWHAAPFNPNYEMYDSDTLGFSFELTHELDARFGLKPKTIASLRDVPGMTRGVIPVMAAHGVRALTGGVNGFSAPPGVPKRTPFVWRDLASGAEILAMWHEGGYAGWHDNLHADNADDCIKAEGFDHVFCASWRDDNGGPPASPAEARAIYDAVRRAWPGARVVASTLEDYAAALLAAAPGLDLPVVTGEIGDTWVHGSACDPLRVADYRAALRARARCVRNATCDSQARSHARALACRSISGLRACLGLGCTCSPAFKQFSRLIIKVAEHTWGLAFDQNLGDVTNYTNAYLHPRLAALNSQPKYARIVESWRRQREYVRWALEELPEGHPILADFEADRQQRHHHSSVSLRALDGAAATTRVPLPPRRPDARGEPGGAAGAWAKAARALPRWLRPGAGGGDRLLGGGGGGGGASAPHGPLHLSSDDGDDDARLVFKSQSWSLELDPWHGGISRLRRVYSNSEGERRKGHDWAADAPHATSRRAAADNGGSGSGSLGVLPPPPPRFLQLQYNVYNESDFQPIWDDCDFGRFNLSASSTLRQQSVPFISDVRQMQDPQHGLIWHVLYEFPRSLVRDAGAPAAAWMVLHSPPDSDVLLVTVAWQNKTATRLPEALWVRFTPGRGAVDTASWRMHKIGSWIDPRDILVNGSHSIHGVSEEGVTVASPDGDELLRIRPHDAPLLALGEPRPFPNPTRGPDMDQGVSACLHNNVWGTNYAEWVPFTDDDVSLAFRFTIEASERPAPAPSVAET
ncbi:hypothetical protein MNEG_4996 [Monoraphidium neglectum]|uniref:Glycoside hydrolase family 38 N-terminal domain-containing protein n=1 Tax=Monoraphidium neglectum TaxID=145388 RepID=A0A0D2NBX4_9CHLO|nr:hypothetical protein MNEG_4996 [Monoraphidium neglectum]KIZ02961.1 hypothetical protein MNEG_4996 [Monoraphidium neglectum]|eukprot:XP_013901980.1 hypothetical protein MNEG_4996 [Monoraphidium neglectum]